MKRYDEALHNAYYQSFDVERVLFESKTAHQHLIIFENRTFGRVMALDGIVQTTERDEFIYHEMLVHTPILAHDAARRVLIVGGGDGGSLREVTRHAVVDHVTQVEIDQTVIDLCRQYLPGHSKGAFDDPRVTIEIADGARYVAETEQRFDVIITDSTDPVGPGAVLFSADYYQACRRCLAPGGILTTQNGVPYFQLDETVSTARHLRQTFADVAFFGAAIPTYVGGTMLFGWASDDLVPRRIDRATLQARFDAAGLVTRYYNPAIHQAAFALPQYVSEALGDGA